MPRIRYLKPDFFYDTTMGKVSLLARYFYLGLWCYLDRNGITEYHPTLIKNWIFPYDKAVNEPEITSIVNELLKNGRLKMVKKEDGKTYLLCPTFKRHQKFHHKEKPRYSKDLFSNAPQDPIQVGASPLLAPFQPPSSRMGNGQRVTGNGELVMGNGELVIGTGTGMETEEVEVGLKEVSSAKALPLLAQIWNQHSGSLPKVITCGTQRTRFAQLRWKEKPDSSYWEDVVKKIATSPFCTGNNNRGWQADFDFLIRPETATKVLEGKYSPRTGKLTPNGKFTRNEDLDQEIANLLQEK